MKRSVFVWLAFVAMAFAQTATAKPLLNVPIVGGYFNSEYRAGTGANSAYFVVDFDGTPMIGGGVYGFDYHWDGTQTADNALLSIDAAGALVMTYDDFGDPGKPNLFIKQLAYPPDSDEPNFSVDGRYWHYWLGTDTAGSVTWTESQYGISGRDFTSGDVVQTLANGGFYGFYASSSDNPPSPRLPVATLQRGDFGLDGRTDVGDVATMMSAFDDLSSYQNGDNSQSIALTDEQLRTIGDFDADGKVTNVDLQGLLNSLANNPGSAALAAVPEPRSWLLTVIAALTATISWRPQRLIDSAFRRRAVTRKP